MSGNHSRAAKTGMNGSGMISQQSRNGRSVESEWSRESRRNVEYGFFFTAALIHSHALDMKC